MALQKSRDILPDKYEAVSVFFHIFVWGIAKIIINIKIYKI